MLNYSLKINNLHQCSGRLQDPKCQIAPLVLTCLDFQTHFFQLFLNESVNWWLWFQIIVKYVLHIGVGVLIGLQWEECYQQRYISISQLILLENTALLFSIRAWIDSGIPLNVFFGVSYFGMLVGCTFKEVQTVFLFCWFSNSYTSQALGLSCSGNVSIEMSFFSILGYF